LKQNQGGGARGYVDNFRVIHGAVTLKLALIERPVAQLSGFPRHSWRGHIEADGSSKAPVMMWRDFRVIHGAVTLKHGAMQRFIS